MAGGFSGYDDFGQHISIRDTKPKRKIIYLSQRCSEAMAEAIKLNPKEINPAMIFGRPMTDGRLRIVDFISGSTALHMITARPPHTQMFEDAQRWYTGARYVMREKFSIVQIGWWLHDPVGVFDWSDVREYEQKDFIEHPYYSLEFDSGTCYPPIIILKTVERENKIIKSAHSLNPMTNRYESTEIADELID